MLDTTWITATPMLADIPDEAVAIVAVGGGLIVALTWIIAATIDSVCKTRAREESRREIAAYVAEGTMSPDDAAKLIAAGRSPKPASTRES